VDMNEPLAKEVHILRDTYGRKVILVDEEGKEEDQAYHILREIELDGRHYCVLQTEENGVEDAYIFRVSDDHKIEHVVDEDEWERAAEAVDELLYYDEI
jgi:uncharacterized protein YrzB (UPF0473 family)